MTTSISIRRESIIKQLELWRGNLAYSEEKAARFGIDVPVYLHNEIRDAKTEIVRLEQMLALNDGSDNFDIQVDAGIDTLLNTMSFIQRRVDNLMSSWMEDHRRVEALWQRANPSVKHRASVVVAGLFLALTAFVWLEFSQVLLGIPVLGAIITAALLAAAPTVYLIGRDDYGD